jgi:putative oxidoreductase
MAGSAKAGPVMALAARILLAAAFLYAGSFKALDPAAFALAIDNYRLLPYSAAVALAVYLPWVEIACGLGLFWPRIRLGALAVVVGLCLVFGGAIASAVLRDLDIGCGCFGGDGGSRASLLISLLRSVALLLMSGWLLGREMRGAERGE